MRSLAESELPIVLISDTYFWLSRECWCAQTFNSLSVKVNDSACDLGCDGNPAEICGGTLKLSVSIMGQI